VARHPPTLIGPIIFTTHTPHRGSSAVHGHAPQPTLAPIPPIDVNHCSTVDMAHKDGPTPHVTSHGKLKRKVPDEICDYQLHPELSACSYACLYGEVRLVPFCGTREACW
ncbi:unnamed protein product, partial [Pleuronectes platessa]